MAVAQLLLEIRDLTDLPQEPNPTRIAGTRPYVRIGREALEGEVVLGIAHAQELRHGGAAFELGQQGLDGLELEIAVAPEKGR